MKMQWTNVMPVMLMMGLLAGGRMSAMAQAPTPPLPELPEPAEAPAPDAPATPAPPPAAPAPAPVAVPPAPPVEPVLAAPAEELLFDVEPANLPPPASGTNIVSVTLEDATLPEVIRLFTRASGANIVFSTSVIPTNLTGTISANLQDVQWLPALKSILEDHRLTISEKEPGSGIYVVQPRPTIEPLYSETIFLRYVNANSNVVRMVQQVLTNTPPAGSVSVHAPANALVLYASRAKLLQVKNIIDAIDKPGPRREQVYIEARFVELNAGDAKNIGINWRSLSGYDVAVMGTGAAIDMPDGGERKQFGDYDRTRDREVSRERTAKDNVTLTGSDTRGSSLGEDPTRDREDKTSYESTADITGTRTAKNVMGDTLAAILTAEEFGVVLSALEQNSDAAVVNNPKIIVANEQTATIDMTTKEPNIEVSRQPGRTINDPDIVTAKLAKDPEYFFEYGTKVEVTPRINEDGIITVQIRPKLSFKEGSKVIGDNSYPIIAEKSVDTLFALEDGKTAAIGGLIKTSDGDAVSKIPLLGDIPILGKYLFSHTSRSKTKSEVVIFVTIGLANPGQDLKKQGLPQDASLIHRRLLKEKLRGEEETAEAAKEAAAVTP